MIGDKETPLTAHIRYKQHLDELKSSIGLGNISNSFINT